MKKNQKAIKIILVFMAVIVLNGCATVPFMTARATITYTTAIYDDLIKLPPPKEKIVAAVYNFRDQTGQYKNQPQVASFSTAVTQGATSMLVKALEDSGWFIPIEREGLANLLNERKIIRSAQESYKNLNKDKDDSFSLPPLLYASLIMEGGVIAYESNVITGGFGARYFGLGGSVETRRDQVTIYLRATAVKNGRILKSVSTTKTILSRAVDFNLYRFVRTKRLMEAEIGLSTNEPTQICVLEAIEKAVYDLILEGVIDGVWQLANPADINSPSVRSYLKEKKEVERIIKFDKKGNMIGIKEEK